MSESLPPIPAKRYFTIGEVAQLCGVKPHVLRYWEQEFGQLRPVKRRGNRRYYQHHEVLMIRRIRELLHVQGFSIQGARQQLRQRGSTEAVPVGPGPDGAISTTGIDLHDSNTPGPDQAASASNPLDNPSNELLEQLLEIRNLLSLD